MRHLKTDVSHRMRRRPSIFSALWFRAILGVGLVVIGGLALGPSLAGLVRGDARGKTLPRVATPQPPPVTVAPAAPAEPASPEAPTTVAAAPSESPARSAENGAKPPRDAEPPRVVPTSEPRPKASAPPADATGGVFRVQVGAFLDHRNADRLIARLRSESFEVADTVSEQSRVLYRLVASGAEGAGREGLLADLRALGFTAETRHDGTVVTAPVPLREAVEGSRALRERGGRVRLERQASSGSYRLVRVGAYRTAEEAERVRTELAGKGFEGFVVRER